MFGRMMVSALALSGAAYAQEAPSAADAQAAGCAPAPTCAVTPTPTNADRIVYDAAFFAQFNPRTALDMVRQTPGFSLDGGDDDRRGFAGAVGNLLIDGQRPTSKSQSLDNILTRIPATQVVRLEVLRGAEVAGDASGQSILLNVVRTATAGSGTWEAGAEVFEDEVSPRGEASYSGRNGQIEYGLGLSLFTQQRSLPGWRILSDAAGVTTGRVDTPSPRQFREGSLNGNIAVPLAGGRLSATSQIYASRFQADNDFIFDFVSDPDFSRFSRLIERNREAELGLNYDRDLGPWSLALIGLANRSQYENEEAGELVGGVTGTDDQLVEQDASETILRTTLARSLTAPHRIEIGGEIAFNSLEQELAFALDGAPVFVPNSNVLIEEERAEVFGSHNWRPNDDWSIETRVAWETSTLTFTGDDNDQEVELSFWKPSIQLTRNLPGENQLRLRVYRDVGQLDFGDFVSAAAVADNLITGGNTGLVPQTDWRTELGGDFRLGPAALSLTLTHHRYDDVADLVRLTNTQGTPDPSDDTFFDAPGNIGEAEAFSLDANFSSPVAFVPGGRITIEGNLWDTEVTDPVTGRDRIISFRPESELEVSFRQDIAAWRMAWGVEYYKEGEFQAYRFNEIDTGEEGPWVDVFVETTALPNNMKLTFWALNVLDGTINRDRRFFEAPDRSGSLTRRDLRQRQFSTAPWFLVQLSGSF